MILTPDGLISATISYMFLKHFNPKANIIVLSHTERQHGLKDVLNQIEPNSFVWIPDAGSNDIEECKYLQSTECEVLITDHHICEQDNPYATVINCQNGGVINKQASGTHVTWKVIEAYCKAHKSKWHSKIIDLVALADISDMMGISYENRLVVQYGLMHITNSFFGELCNEFIKNEITPTSISFNVTPKINAVLRSDNQELKTRLFSAFVGEDNDFISIIKEMKFCHRTQSELVKQTAQELSEQLDDSSKVNIVFCDKGAYNGLICNRLLGDTNKSSFVLHNDVDDIYTGSLRSDIDMKSTLSNCPYVNYIRGHSEAAGIEINDIVGFTSYCNQLDLPEPSTDVICSLDATNINESLWNIFDGYDMLWSSVGLKQPLFHIHLDNINSNEIQELKGATIKIVHNRLTFIKFFVSNVEKQKYYINQNVNLDIDIIGQLSYNEFRGNKTRQIIIDKMECTEHKEKIFDWSEIFKED